MQETTKLDVDEVAEFRSKRTKFVDEMNYFEGLKTLEDIACEVQGVVKTFGHISRGSMLISTLAEELENCGFAITDQFRKSTSTKSSKLKSTVPIVCKKAGFKIAIGFCDSKPRKETVDLLNSKKATARLLFIRNPDAYVSKGVFRPPAGIFEQILLTTRQYGSKSGAQSHKSAAAGEEGVGKGRDGSVGGGGTEGPIRLPFELRSPGRRSPSETIAGARGKSLIASGSSTKLDWAGIDKYGNPIVSFDPAHPLRSKILLAITTTGKLRNAILEKLSTEASRIYERYRKADQRARGLAPEVVPIDEKRLEQLCIGCLERGITPRQVLEYWHSRVNDFTHGSLRVPTIRFISSVNNLDQVAASNIGVPKLSSGKLKTATERNSFSDIEGLDVRLRPGLERAGFDTTMFNDRYLLSVQHNAIGIASGHDLLIPDGRFGKMIHWAAENLYKAAA